MPLRGAAVVHRCVGVAASVHWSGWSLQASPVRHICCVSCVARHQNSIVGSIGVVSGQFGLDKWIKRFDIDRRMYSAGACPHTRVVISRRHGVATGGH